jgi:hypothetical protein
METLTPYCEVIGNPNSFVEYDLPTQETLLDKNTKFFFSWPNSNHLPAQNASCNMHNFQPTVQSQHQVPTLYKGHGEALENEPPTHYYNCSFKSLSRSVRNKSKGSCKGIYVHTRMLEEMGR